MCYLSAMPNLEAASPERDLFGNPASDYDTGDILARRFGVVPFSVLDARQGRWQKRKRAWVELGIKGEEGRIDTSTESEQEFGAQRTGPNSPWRTHGYKDPAKCYNTGRPGDLQAELKQRNVADEKGYGFAAAKNAGLDEKTQRAMGVMAGDVQPGKDGVAGTSVFDPVLCESVYKWFAKPGGSILDPFAGESTKGIVAAYLGYDYTGIELRQSQIDANNRQAGIVQAKVQERMGQTIPMPQWVLGDSSKLSDVLDEHAPFEQYDFLWTSPPYYDLEIYSESEKDGSAFETYEKFIAWYRDIFAQAVARLRDNRFLAVKVGEIRDEKGFYRNFVGDNITVFRDLGLHYYNEIILVTAVGSLPVRIGNMFPNYRKIGKTHQNILVFYKGASAKDIPNELGLLSQDDITEGQ